MKTEYQPTFAFTDKSIAVLPFVNMSADADNEYFSDGITEEIINALTRVKGLKVIARTSSFAFKNKQVDIRIIGNELNVNTLLEGSVRRFKNRVRITAQLVRTDNGTHLWSQNFDRELDDIFAVQDEISLLVADQVREHFGHLEIQDHLIDAPTDNLEAYQLYLKARYHHLKWNSDGISNAIRLYQECIEQAPEFAWPYFGLGYCFAMRGSWRPNEKVLQKAAQILDKGFALDSENHLGYFAKATLYFWGYWDFAKAIPLFEKAIELNPAHTESEEGLIELYTALGQFDKAQQHCQNILYVNPLSHNHYFTLGNIHYLSENFKQALDCLESALRIDPNFTHAITKKQLCLLFLNDYQQLDRYLAEQPLTERPQVCRALYQLMHEQHPALDQKWIELEQEKAPEVSLVTWELFLHVQMEHEQLAMDLLETAIKKKTGQYINFQYEPLYKPLRKHKRFQKLVKTVFGKTGIDHAPTRPLPSNSTRAVFTEEEQQNYLNTIEKVFETEKPYLNTNLSLRDLAEKIDLHPNKLSFLLNEANGTNFNEFVNSYRLAAFKQKALQPENSHLTILGLAYESGFNSKTVFNTFFKKQEGVTPRKWLTARKS